MQIAIVGLGRMGANMGRRLMRAKHEVVVYDLRSESVQALAKVGAIGASDSRILSRSFQNGSQWHRVWNDAEPISALASC
jgi:6-phosphogluconate dehydrogenase